ncbi:MAG: right-handed parallel beta-helix repeat-containing protein [Cyanomargarita calcarea GSE-NOS-MK-12-04C]|uniref:Right-handed parallel beta-helix repeat-containing protein n=1 Tax=Cyanomargarita calcarea GSE-NOS-MK-12-04C TaxID=2839659 RepID=A0A951UTW2_9CYAN|nr:right-handed parallel beta-helix repeat-containing protein [Cyanomargarita calcarea GSE-NOS-MK-12-04C]
MKKFAPAFLILIFSGAIALGDSQGVIAQTTNINPKIPRFSGSFTSTGAGYEEPYFSIQGFIPIKHTPASSLTFFEGQLNFLTDSTKGGNLVLGHRFKGNGNELFGGYLAYDVRDTGNNVFSQIGFGLERLGNWDVRINGYLPLGNTSKQTAESLSSPRFWQNFLVSNAQKQFQVALAGADIEAGGRLAGLGEGDLRGYAGLYYYTGEGMKDAIGVRGRLEARPTENLRLGLMLQHDPVFDTRLVLNLGVSFATGRAPHPKEPSIFARITDPVGRTPIITVSQQARNTQVVATNPETGKPWQFRHVNLGTGNGEGTIENPTGTVQTALNIAEPEDIVYVDFSKNPGIDSFSIPDKVSVLSTSPVQTIDTKEFGLLQLPKSGSGQLPTVRGTVTLGNDSTLSGFAIANATGNAIQGSGINNVTIRDNQITNPTGQGIGLSGVGGNNLIANNRISGTAGQGIFLQGFGDGQQLFTIKDNTISNSGAQGLVALVSGNAKQEIIASNNLVSNSTGAGVFIQANDNSRQVFNLDGGIVRGTVKDRLGEGGQGIFIAANSAAQQTFTLDKTSVSDNVGQGIFLAANGTAQQKFILNSPTVNRSGGQGIFAQANENAKQQFEINQATVSGTVKDSNGDGGQGIFVAANTQGQQKFTLNSSTVSDNSAQGIFLAANGAAQQNFSVNIPTVNRNIGQGIFVQANGAAKQEFEINKATVSSTLKDSKDDGGQGLFISVNGGAQQRFNLNSPTITNSAGQGIFISTSGDINNPTNLTQQTFTLNNPTVNRSRGQGIFIQANDNVKQEFTITDGKVNSTNLDSKNEGGQGIFVQANGVAQQNFIIDNLTVTDSAGQGLFIQSNTNANLKSTLSRNIINNSIFLQTNGNSQATLNILENQLIDGLIVGMNSKQAMCLALRGNNSKTGYLLQQNSGKFQVVDRDNVASKNTGAVTFQPGKDNFINVPACP